MGEKFSLPVSNAKYWKIKDHWNEYMAYFGMTRFKSNGERRLHGGVDLVPANGEAGNEPVYSIAPGQIIKADGESKTLGNLVIIKHNLKDEIYYSYYAHLKSYAVSVGEKVLHQQYIGNIGSTGNARKGQEHLHLEIRDKNWKRLDPSDFLELEKYPGRV